MILMRRNAVALLIWILAACILCAGCGNQEKEPKKTVTVHHREVLDGLDPTSYDNDGTVVALEKSTLKVTIPNFDADSIPPEDREYWYCSVDQNTRFFTEYTMIRFDEENNEYDETTYEDIGYDGFITTMETGSAVCHFWVNENGCCTHVVIYGSTTIC